MSQFIVLEDRLIEFRQAHREVVTGTLSKLSLFRSSLSLGGPPRYLRQKVSLRVRHEEGLALTTHELSLHHNYHKLKHNLQLYARSKSLKLDHAFERQTAAREERNSLKGEKGERRSVKAQREERTVFIDRKYNREFAISSAMAQEMTAIAEEKCRLRKLMSEQQVSPLARQARATFAGQAAKREGNPVLGERQGVQLRKKRKGNQYSFAPAARDK